MTWARSWTHQIFSLLFLCETKELSLSLRLLALSLTLSSPIWSIHSTYPATYNELLLGALNEFHNGSTRTHSSGPKELQLEINSAPGMMMIEGDNDHLRATTILYIDRPEEHKCDRSIDQWSHDDDLPHHDHHLPIWSKEAPTTLCLYNLNHFHHHRDWHNYTGQGQK